MVELLFLVLKQVLLLLQQPMNAPSLSQQL
jgi:hypothetical protein